MEVKICDLCGRRIYPTTNGVSHFSCKVKKPRKYKWLNLIGGYEWSDIEFCTRCAENIADMSLKKDPFK